MCNRALLESTSPGEKQPQFNQHPQSPPLHPNPSSFHVSWQRSVRHGSQRLAVPLECTWMILTLDTTPNFRRHRYVDEPSPSLDFICCSDTDAVAVAVPVTCCLTRFRRTHSSLSRRTPDCASRGHGITNSSNHHQPEPLWSLFSPFCTTMFRRSQWSLTSHATCIKETLRLTDLHQREIQYRHSKKTRNS